MQREALSAYMAAAVILTAALSFAFAKVSSALAWKLEAVDRPTGGRKQHGRTVPLWGGLGIAAAFLLGVGALSVYGGFAYGDVSGVQIAGFVIGVGILLLGGLIDDRRPLPPSVQILFPILASIVVIATGTSIEIVSNPFTGGGFSLVWRELGPFSFPSHLVTFAWLIVATYATKIQDGLDGLVCGLAVIGSALVSLLSSSVSYFQPAVAVLSSLVGGAFLGFLPKNANPAKQFLGEAGSTIAGFSLGVLAVLSSAKLAIALCVLAIPIADAVVVVIGRLRRGVPWFQGDRTHLHFRLLALGLSQRATAFLLWGVSLFAGILALGLQTRGKYLIVSSLVVFAIVTSYYAGFKSRQNEKASLR